MELNLEIPFPSKREAEIVYNTLRVDVEPKRKNIKKTLTVEDNKLIVNLTAPDEQSLRIGMNSFMDLAILSTETIEKFDLSVAES